MPKIIGTLSKKIPSRTKTVHFLWCKKDAMLMDEQYRQIRSRFKNPMDKCWWCGHNFENGEMMALACADGRGNKMLCQECAGKLKEEEECS